MQKVQVRCPVCGSNEEIVLSEEEIKKVISHITKNGKSPFYLHTCKNGHVFTVTLSYDKSAEKLYVRDISPVLKPDETSSNLSNSNKKDDWIKRHFG